MNEIILTDWPKLKHIEANMRGLRTEILLELESKLSHTMMSDWTEEFGGYYINYNIEKIREELEFRGA